VSGIAVSFLYFLVVADVKIAGLFPVASDFLENVVSDLA
jgi:hypothetical protein